MNPIPDSIVLILAAATGCGIGIPIGFAMASRAKARLARETWSAARRFYEAAYTLTPKG